MACERLVLQEGTHGRIRPSTRSAPVRGRYSKIRRHDGQLYQSKFSTRWTPDRKL